VLPPRLAPSTKKISSLERGASKSFLGLSLRPAGTIVDRGAIELSSGSKHVFRVSYFSYKEFILLLHLFLFILFCCKAFIAPESFKNRLTLI
jgi:hypothetical protein